MNSINAKIFTTLFVLVISSFFTSNATASTLTDWRLSNSYLFPENTQIHTSKSRESYIANLRRSMLDRIFNHIETPRMELILEDGIKAEFYSPKWETTEIPEITITQPNFSGTLRGTLALPVSGHTGSENAKLWSKTDTFNITLKNSKGRSQTLIQQAKSLNEITFHDVEIPLTPGWNQLFYIRSGTKGVKGYPEGRTIKIYWEGNNNT